MQTIILLIYILTAIQGIISLFLFVKSDKNKEHVLSKKETKSISDKEKQIKSLNSFDSITIVLSIVIGAITMVLIVINHIIPKYQFNKNVSIVLLLIAVVYLFYVYSNHYHDLKYIRKVFFDKSETKINIHDLSKAALIISFLYICLGNHINLYAKSLKTGSLYYQLYLILESVMTVVVFCVLAVTCIIVIIYSIKSHKLNTIILDIREKIICYFLQNIPTRKYIKNNGKWRPSKCDYIQYMILDSLYRFVMLPIILLDTLFMALYLGTIGFMSLMGIFLKIQVNVNGYLGKAQSFISLLGWSVILSLTTTYIIVSFSNEFDSAIKDLYSFITGIIVIPAIISAVLQRHNYGGIDHTQDR